MYTHRILLILSIVTLFHFNLKAQNPGDFIFSDERIHEIKIDMHQKNYWDSLNYYFMKMRQTDETTYMLADVKINDETIDSIGLRIKGNSSYGHPGKKKSLKLDFDRYIDGTKYDGLKKINLNNGFLDPTMMREKLYLDFLNELNLPAPRCSYAEVYLNDEYIGLYKIIEQIDKTYLKTNFGNNDGNLFKGDPGGSLNWAGPDQKNYYPRYELKTNETENNWNDLIRLIRIINGTPIEKFKDSIEAVFDVEQYLKIWAANNVFVNLDSYVHNPHNYYLYHNETTGKFDWITWDVSVVFGVFPFWSQQETESISILFVPDSIPLVLHRKLFMIPEYKEQYLNEVCMINREYFKPEILFPKIDNIAEKIRSSIYKEKNSNKMFPNEVFERNLLDFKVDFHVFEIPGLKYFINKRRQIIFKEFQRLGTNCDISDIGERDLNSDLKFEIYPNPVKESFFASLSESPQNENYILRIYDIFGEEIMMSKIKAGKILINRGQVSSGFYFYCLSAGFKIIKSGKLIFK